MTKRRSLYVVARAVPSGSQYASLPVVYVPNLDSSSELLPVAGFADEAAADRERARLERLARETTSVAPFLFTLGPEEVEQLTAAIKAAGLPPLKLASIGPPM